VRLPPARRRILDAALELFLRDGYPAVSVADVAAAADTSRATFYVQFDSKADLLAELTERFVDQAMGVFAEFGDLPDTSESALRGWIERLVDLWAADAELIRLLVANRSAETLEVERARLDRAVAAVVRNPRHWSALEPAQVQARAFALVVSQRQVLAEWVLFSWPIAADELIQFLTQMWEVGLTGRGPRRAEGSE
jgi:AcrR family transcriptional regulator